MDNQANERSDLEDEVHISKIACRISNIKVEEYESLTSIDISSSNISELPSFFEKLTSLQILIANRNHITSLPPALDQLTKLQKLSLAHNRLSCLPHSFCNLHLLEVLDLSFNEFVSTPNAFKSGCAGIALLNMSHNSLMEWNAVPACARSLKRLDLSYNKLQENPAWIWGDLCQSLIDLNLRNNNFRNVANVAKQNQLWSSGAKESLLSLNVAYCGISSNNLNFVHQLKSLTVLNIGNKEEPLTEHSKSANYLKSSFKNAIWTLSLKPFHSKFSLCELVISSLGLSLLPDEISCLETLKVIDCSCNDLTWLPQSLCKLTSLRVAVFTSNQLSYIPEDIGMLVSLEELWLDNNEIEDLPASIGDLPRLCWLDLYSNRMEELPLGVKKLLPNLSGIDLDFNFFSFENEEYKKIKTVMRQHPQLGVNRKMYRTDGRRPKSESITSTSSDESEEDEMSSTAHSDELKDEPEDSREVVSEDEVWDLEEDENDRFDPTCVPPSSAISYPSRHTCYSQDADLFCPGDAHAAPSAKARKSQYQPDNGQFDDA